MKRRFPVFNIPAFRRAALVSSLALFSSVAGTAVAEDLTEAKFQELHKSLRPPADTPWLSIPWKVDLLEAQDMAARANKPIFIWAMDGHPLGCT